MLMRGNAKGKRADKTGLVTAAVMFATKDHATTYRKGGTESLSTVYALHKKRSIWEKSRAGAGYRPSSIPYQTRPALTHPYEPNVLLG